MRSNFDKFKDIVKKIWKFLIHDDSIWSFAADAVLIIIIGKFILIPLLGLFLGTSFPVVSVVTSSMDHSGMDFEEWWQENGEWYEDIDISKEQFQDFKFKNGFEKGDGLILLGTSKNEIEIGDVIVFNSPEGPIIHRAITLDPVSTKGDANNGQLVFEKNISESNVEGNSLFLIPFIGWPKALLIDIINLVK